jgi:hypothetical protein
VLLRRNQGITDRNLSPSIALPIEMLRKRIPQKPSNPLRKRSQISPKKHNFLNLKHNQKSIKIAHLLMIIFSL